MLQVLTVTTHCSTRNFLSSPTAICAGSLEQSMGARNQVGIGLSYRRTTIELELLNNLWGLGAEQEQGYRTGLPEPKFSTFREPKNRFQRTDSCIAWRAGTTTLFLLGSQPPIDCLKIPAQATQAGGIHSLESIPGLHKRSKIRVHAT